MSTTVTSHVRLRPLCHGKVDAIIIIIIIIIYANLILALAAELLTLRAYMSSHASAAQVVPYVTSKSTILSGVPYAEQTFRLSKNRQVCSPERTSVPTGLH